MSLITRALRQKCVYWAPGKVDTFGQATYEDPVELACRWDELQVNMVDDKGETFMSQAEVMVGQDVLRNGMMLLHDLDSTISATPSDHKDAFRIRQFEKTPNLRATEFHRIAYLWKG